MYAKLDATAETGDGNHRGNDVLGSRHRMAQGCYTLVAAHNVEAHPAEDMLGHGLLVGIRSCSAEAVMPLVVASNGRAGRWVAGCK